MSDIEIIYILPGWQARVLGLQSALGSTKGERPVERRLLLTEGPVTSFFYESLRS